MVPLDNMTAIAEWIGSIFKEIVTGIRNTWFYWRHRQAGLEELVSE